MNAPVPAKIKKPIFYGWWIVVVVALAQWGQTAEIFPVLSVLLKPITEELHWSRTDFTAATSVGTLLGGAVGPLVGWAVDKWGSRWILSISFAILAVTMIQLAFVTQLWQFYVNQIIARFLALGVISLAIAIVVPQWFVAKRARAVAYSGLGGRFGNALTPVYVQWLVTMWSWRVATISTGVVMIVTSLLPVLFFMRRRPEDMGLLPDGLTPEELEEQKRVAAEARDGSGSGGARRIASDISFSVKEVIRMPSFYFLFASNTVGSIVGPALNLHMIPFFTDRGLSPSVAVLVTTVLFTTSAVGSLVFGFLSERWGVRTVATLNFALQGLTFAMLATVTSAPMAFLWGALQGLLQGGNMTLVQVLFADYYGRASLGTIRGLMNPVQLAANAAGPLFAALVFDSVQSYVFVWLTFGVLRVLSGVLVALAKPPTGVPAAATPAV
ncbi:MAG: MFS transporter [Chloroflexota bacterium]